MNKSTAQLEIVDANFLVVAPGYASPENADDFKDGFDIVGVVVKQVTGQSTTKLRVADADFSGCCPRVRITRKMLPVSKLVWES